MRQNLRYGCRAPILHWNHQIRIRRKQIRTVERIAERGRFNRREMRELTIHMAHSLALFGLKTTALPPKRDWAY